MSRALLEAALSQNALIRWVALTVVTLFALVSLAMLALLIHHAVTRRRRQRRQSLREAVIAVLAPAAADPAGLAAAVTGCRRRFGLRATGSVLRELRQRVRGEIGEALTREIERIGEVERLRRLAGSRASWRRSRAAHKLGQCGGATAGRALAGLLDDPEPEVREAARDAALVSGQPELLEAAVASFRADRAALGARRLGFYARLAAVAPEALHGLAAGGGIDAADEKLALESLGHVRYAAANPLAEARLASGQAELRASAVRFLGRLAEPGRRAPVAALLRDPEWFVRAAAARALETLGVGPGERAALVLALHDPAWWVRANAARSLARHGHLDALVDAAQGADRFASDVAIGALAAARELRAVEARLRLLAAERPEDDAVRGLLRRLDREAA